MYLGSSRSIQSPRNTFRYTVNAELRLAEVIKRMRMRMRTWFVLSARVAGRLLTLVCLSLAMLGVALADDESDPPGRVARLSYVQGSVSLEPSGAQDWVGAEINRPLTTNDKLWSDTPGSRAELDMGGAVVRLGSGTGFSFLNLDDNMAQMQVTTGTVVVHVRELLENQTYEIDTPNLSVLLDEPGQYRVDVNESGDTTVVRVADGHAEASNGNDSMPIANQQMVTFSGTEDQVSANTATLGTPDGFDDWSFERDREYERAASRQYVPDNLVGTEDLDENGEWQSTPDYGPVWVPTTVAVGWSPYSFGHWAWVAPWGWTWIDDAPWGYAPFHYGRWARWHDSWCWVPGPRLPACRSGGGANRTRALAAAAGGAVRAITVRFTNTCGGRRAATRVLPNTLCRAGAIAGGAPMVAKRPGPPAGASIRCACTGWAEVKTLRGTVVTAPAIPLLT